MIDPIRVSLGNEADFQVFSKKIYGKDRATIAHYWRCAKKKNHLLVVRRVGPHYSQCVVMPLDTLPTLDKSINLPKFQSPSTRGSLFLNVPMKRFFAFGGMVLEAEKNGNLHRSEFDVPIEIPEISHIDDRTGVAMLKVHANFVPASMVPDPPKPKKKAKKDAK